MGRDQFDAIVRMATILAVGLAAITVPNWLYPAVYQNMFQTIKVSDIFMIQCLLPSSNEKSTSLNYLVAIFWAHKLQNMVTQATHTGKPRIVIFSTVWSRSTGAKNI